LQYSRTTTNLYVLDSKFFGKANGAKPPAKQSTLAFSTKSSGDNAPPSSGSSKENEDVEMMNEELEVEIKPKIDEETKAVKKENANPPTGMRPLMDIFTSVNSLEQKPRNDRDLLSRKS
jgi:hypothetical protein